MVATLKFSDFVNAGNLISGKTVVGLSSSVNARFAMTPSTFFPWVVETTTPVTMVTNSGYITNSASLVVLNLPLVSSVGDELSIAGMGTGGWSIHQAAGQSIVIGIVTSTAGISGSVSSQDYRDSMNLVCIVANLQWTVIGAPQSRGLIIV